MRVASQKFAALALASLILLGGFASIAIGVEATAILFSQCRLSGVVYDPTLGWKLKASQHWTIYSFEPNARQFTITTNSRGFRDTEHSRAKPSGATRILFLGDSYTAALEYPDETIFTRRFTRLLEASAGEKNRFEIMTASVPAWATDQEYLYLKNEGIDYQPDYVVLMVAPNDIREGYAKGFFSRDGEQLVQNGLPPIPWKDRAYWFLANHSCAFQYWQRRSHSGYGTFDEIFRHFSMVFAVGPETSNDRHLFLRTVPAEIAAARDLFKSLLLRIQRLCNDNHCKLLLAIIPTKIEYDGSLKDPEYRPGAIADYIEALASENNIPFLNLVRALEAEEKDPLIIFIAKEYHLSDAGHRFVAKHLIDFFKANQRDSAAMGAR